MRREGAALFLAAVMGLAGPSMAQRGRADGGMRRDDAASSGEPAPKKRKASVKRAAPTAKKKPATPRARPPRSKKTSAATEPASKKAPVPPPKGRSLPPTPDDREVIDHLEMLLLLDLLADYDLFDDDEDATLSGPDGLKEYRP